MSVISDSGGIFLASDLTVGVRFQMWPDSIDDSKSVNWAGIDVVGRSEPIMTYHSSTSQRFALTLVFHASVDASDEGTPGEVKRKVDFLKSLTYPVRSKAGYSTYPPVVQFIVGDLINSRCVVNTVNAVWEGPWEIVTSFDEPAVKFNGRSSGLAVREKLFGNFDTYEIETEATLPLMARVKLELTVVNLVPLDHATVMSRGDFSTVPRKRVILE